MNRRIIVGLLAFLLVSTAAASLIDLSIGTASADTSGDLQYSLINGGTAVKITGYTGSGGSVTIPGTIAGEPVTAIGDSAFMSSYHLTGIAIPNSVTFIGNNSFNSCIRLAAVTIPGGVTFIGNNAFANCYALTSLTIPSSVTSMGTYAFANEHKLVSATVNSHILPDGTFSGCGVLTSVTFGAGLTRMGNLSFYGCAGLTAITIPSTVTYIGTEVFSACPSLVINVDASNPDYSSANGALFDKAKTALVACPTAAGVFTVPDGVTTIGRYALEDTVVNSVTIPSSVTTIGGYAFYACAKLTSATIGSGVTTIGEAVFMYCTALSSISFYGLASPTNVAVDSWIWSTHGTVGHAYYASNFPAPGHVWAGLMMGSYVSNTSVAPDAPVSITATGGVGYIFLNWSAPVNVGTPPLTQFNLYRATSPGGYGSPLVSLNSGIATYNDTSVTPGTQYYYVVKGVNSAGSSPASKEVTAIATTAALSVPGAPANLQAVGHDGYVLLTWDPPANAGNPPLQYYSVWRGTIAGSLALFAYGGASPGYNDTNVVNGQSYIYEVKAVNTVGTGPASNDATATAGGTGTPTTPSAPQGFTATPGTGKVTLAWSAPANNGGALITGYKIYRSNGGGSASELITTGGGTLTYQDTTGTVGTTYSYYVVAVNSVGSGAQSSVQSAAPQSGGGGTGSTNSSGNGALLAGVGVLVVVVIVLIVLFFFMKKRKR